MYKVLIAMLAMLMIAGSAMAQDDKEPVRCDYCGMFWEKSSTRFMMDAKVDGKTSSHHFESLGCAFNTLAELKDGGAKEIEIIDPMILDYSSFGSKKETMINARKAWFLVETGRLKGSMAPFVAAFASKDAAEGMQEELGGELMDHDTMHAWFMSGGEKAMHEGHGHMMADADVYVCPCEGDCCDDISSDKPGECERCGMTLVKKSEK